MKPALRDQKWSLKLPLISQQNTRKQYLKSFPVLIQKPANTTHFQVVDLGQQVFLPPLNCFVQSWWVIPSINSQKSISIYPWFMIMYFPFLEILLLNVYMYISDVLLFSSCWKQISLPMRTESDHQQKTSEYIMTWEHLYICILKDKTGWEEIKVKIKCCCL